MKKQRRIALLYIGMPRFKDIGKSNHKLLIDALQQKWPVVEYDYLQPNLDRSLCPFPANDTGAARIQIWDFYESLQYVNEQIVIKLRSDIWFSKSSIDAVIKEIELIISGKQDISYLGCDTSNNFSEKYFKIPTKKGKILDLVIIVNKDKIKKKDQALTELQTGKLAHLRSGNSTWKVLTTPWTVSYKVFCQIYIIRKDQVELNDWTMGYHYIDYYLPDTVQQAKQWWLNNKEQVWL